MPPTPQIVLPIIIGPNGLPISLAPWNATRISGNNTAGLNFAPVLYGPTAPGMTVITLLGNNFGQASPLNCPVLPWSGRNQGPGYTPNCNGGEDYLGEGEIAQVRSRTERNAPCGCLRSWKKYYRCLCSQAFCRGATNWYSLWCHQALATKT